MIGSLRGLVLDRIPAAAGQGELLLEVGGVGYRVTVGPATLAGAEVGEVMFLHVHTHGREGAAPVLYGFAGGEERTCFEALIAAHGVGPSLALAVLAALSPPSLRRAIATGDVEALTSVAGVGRKTAARLLIELKPRLDVAQTDPVAADEDGEGARSQVRAALAGLGYGPDEVRQAIAQLDPEASVEELVSSALRRLASGSRLRVGAPS